MQPENLKLWRKNERERLVAARLALDAATLARYQHLIDAHIARTFPDLAKSRIGFCWPIRNEYDARHLAKRLRDQGALTALPVVVARGAPLVFREWHPGVKLVEGALGIPYPVGSRDIEPEVLLPPMNGWDKQGYRLGYGAGFFDRTLASFAKRPVTIGIGYELAHMPTIYPQSWDMPLDYVITERGSYRRSPSGLEFMA